MLNLQKAKEYFEKQFEKELKSQGVSKEHLDSLFTEVGDWNSFEELNNAFLNDLYTDLVNKYLK